MAAAAKNYSATDVSVVFAGIPLDSGFADGTFVKISPAADQFGEMVGADGQTARFKTNNKNASVEVTLMQTSDANARLSALALLDANASNGAGVGPFFLTDRGGTTVIKASKAWIKKLPDIEFAREITTRTWTLHLADMDFVVGGN